MSSPYRSSNTSPFGPDRNTGRRDTVMFFLCVITATTFLLGPPKWGEMTASTIRGTVLVPFLWLQGEAEESRNLRARFESVEAQRDSVAWGAQALPALRAENERLRKLLGITPRINVPYRPAEILRQSQITDGRTLVVGAGAQRGVRPFDPVISPEGLVGVILSTERATSVAMTWAHPEFRVSATTEDGSVLGLVALAQTTGDDEPLLELRGVPYRDTVPAGTLVVTTGLGGIYPNGVPIGRVFGVPREQKGWERIYLIRPAVNLGTVGHVLVLARNEAGTAALAAAAQAPETRAAPVVTPPAAVDSTPPRRRRPRPAATTADSPATRTPTDSAVKP